MTINYITGYAGTGKSTRLLEKIKSLPDTSVVICPTHKAIKRLVDSLDFETAGRIEIKTIHALLGWIPAINEDAEHVNHINVTKRLERELEDYTNIVIDEGSMMSEEMLMEITSKLEERHNFETDGLTIDIYLDPYQLPPVKGKPIMTDPDTTLNLTKQYRAESPDVVELFTKFVQYLEGTNSDDLTTPASANVHHVTDISQFKDGDRLLAYTNYCVGTHNEALAKKFGKKGFEGEYVQLGNKLNPLKVEKFIEPDLDELVNLYNCELLHMQNNKINEKFLEPSLNAMLKNKHIKWIEVNSYVIPVICGINHAYTARKEAEKLAIQDRKNFKHVYALGRAFTMDYTYASTVHKSQGSEWDRVWVVKSDIQKSIMNNYYETYARLMYVAISRARKEIFIL